MSLNNIITSEKYLTNEKLHKTGKAAVMELIDELLISGAQQVEEESSHRERLQPADSDLLADLTLDP